MSGRSQKVKLTYLATIRFPTEKAHGLAVAKMGEALAEQRTCFELVVPKRKQLKQLHKIYWEKFYGVKKPFSVKRLACLDLLWLNTHLPKTIWILTFYLLKLSFCWSVFSYVRQQSRAVFYSREIILAVLPLMLKKPVFLELHSWPETWLGKKLIHFWATRFIGIICISEPLEKRLLDLKITREKILMATGGVSQDFFHKINPKKIRKRLKLPLNKIVVMYVGSLGQEKGIGVLLEAMHYLVGEKQLAFVVVGGSFIARENEYFQERVKRLRLDNLTYISYQPPSKIAELLAAADILTLPNSLKSREDIYKKYTSPMKLFEYLASGKPVIAAKIPALTWLVKDKKEVLFFRPDEARDLAEKIKLLLRNPNLAKKLSRNGQEFVKQYTWEKRAARVVEFIRSRILTFSQVRDDGGEDVWH